MRQRDKIALFRLIPPKVAVAILGVLIAYALLQPLANSAFGWSLPSLVSILNLDFRPDHKADKTVASKESTNSKKPSKKSEPNANANSAATDVILETPKQSEPKTRKRADTPKSTEESDLKFGILKLIGRDRYQSPAGLTYGPGSEEGHRLKHLERHLVDDPNRPGPHGVFDGDMSAFLKAIDDAYTRASDGAKGTTTHTEEDSTVYEASFTKPIGFMGGTQGAEKKHPKLKRLRVVVSQRNNNIITAFPF